MSFIDNIKESLGLVSIGEPLYRAVIFGENSVYIENVKGIISYSKDRIEVLLKSGTLIIVGENLVVKKYCGGDLAICGKVKNLTKT